MNLYLMDRVRYENKKDKMLIYMKHYRMLQECTGIKKIICKLILRQFRKKYHLEIPNGLNIGGGFYIGHPYGITINPGTIIGKNVNIHKGVTIGVENRGTREGAPSIGDEVWIGINSVIVGAIKIGNDVLIAPNSFVNRDVPDHSIVFGNPCIIKSSANATEGYVEFKCT